MKIHLKLYLLLTSLSFFGLASFAQTIDCGQFFLSRTPFNSLTRFQDPIKLDVQSLEEDLFAVHVTDIMPEEGTIVAGALELPRDGGAGVISDEGYRKTVHFSLGEMVQPHEGGSWEKKSFAILTPFKEIAPQTVNINPYDTFILGDFRIPKNAVVIVPQGYKGALPSHVQVRRYAEKTKSLREAVDEVIQQKKGISVKMQKFHQTNHNPALVGRTNINSPDFFKELQKKHPHIAYGNHQYSVNNHNASVFFRIEDINHVMKDLDASWRYAPETVALLSSELNIIEDELLRLRRLLVSNEAHKVLDEVLNKIPSWRKKLFSFLPAQELTDPRVYKILQSHRFYSTEDFVRMLKNSNLNLSSENYSRAVAQHFVENVFLKGKAARGHEHFTAAMEALSPRDVEEVQEVFRNNLLRYIRKDNSMSLDILGSFSSSEMRIITKKYFSFELETPPQTLEDFFKVHPETRNLYSNTFNFHPDEFAAISLTDPFTFDRLELYPSSFTEASLAKDLLEEGMENDRLKRFLELEARKHFYQPMKSDNPLYRDLRVKHSRKLWERLESLSHKDNLLYYFKNEQDFWNSTESLFEILQKLKLPR